jgi:hypothetical protein
MLAGSLHAVTAAWRSSLFLSPGTPFAGNFILSKSFQSERLPKSPRRIRMRAKHVVGCLLLVATAVVSGCDEKRDLIGRWDMGKSNFYFRGDGVVFYLSSAKVRYQGRYYYDDSKDPGILRADLATIDGNGNPFTLEFQVTFLGQDTLRLVNMNGGPKRSTLASRMAANPGD